MAIYQNVPINEAYKLLNAGALILLSTADTEMHLNLTPISWHCPVDDDPVTKLLFVTNLHHKAFFNIQATENFVVCIPHASQLQMVRDMGSVSGFQVNKLKHFNVEYTLSEKCQLAVPANTIAYIECRKLRVIEEAGVAMILGEVIFAKVLKDAYRDRLLSEKEAGKTLHHLGKDVFIQSGNLVE